MDHSNHERVYASLDEEDVYADPGDTTTLDRSYGYSEVVVDSTLGTYAEPDTPTDSNENDIEINPIYQASPIYESSSIYENPYSAVTGSSLYADPNATKERASVEIRQFPRNRLRFVEEIGAGQFGEVHICEVDNFQEVFGNDPHVNWYVPGTIKVAVKTLKAGVDKTVEVEFMKEVRVMARLKHDNVVQLLGICRDEPKCMVLEYMENGDLNQFLKNCESYNGPPNPCVSQLPSNILLVDSLLHMVTQIAAGMKYLASQGFIHRDLATRNCLVGHSFTVKISDFGMSRYLYSKQYYRIEGKAVLPIRWMAPESLFYGKIKVILYSSFYFFFWMG